MYLVCRENPKFEETIQMRDAAKELGMEVSDYPICGIKEGFFVYGTRDFCLRKDVNGCRYIDNPYHILNKLEHQYEYSYLYSLAGHCVFNDCPVFTPANKISRVIHPTVYDKYFVRPNSGDKQFTGRVFTIGELRNNFPLNNQISPWELCVVNSVKNPPEKEYRFFIHNDHMIGSEYWPENSDNIPNDVNEFAKKAVEHIRCKDPNALTFVLDIGYSDDVLSCIEINSFNSSALYSVPSSKILEILSGDSN